jgi:O-6-methylguanine DNA methyltransferase
MANFSKAVKKVVRKIPPGKVLTYKEVAEKAGNPKAARAVANVMAKNSGTNYDQTVPCHRVIRSDGGLGGYSRGGTAVKEKILRKEGAIK